MTNDPTLGGLLGPRPATPAAPASCSTEAAVPTALPDRAPATPVLTTLAAYVGDVVDQAERIRDSWHGTTDAVRRELVDEMACRASDLDRLLLVALGDPDPVTGCTHESGHRPTCPAAASRSTRVGEWGGE